jgi:multiple sugar transport system permease protein
MAIGERPVPTGMLFRPKAQTGSLTGEVILGKVGHSFLYIVLLVLFLTPFLWMFFGALRDQKEILGQLFPFTWHTIVPIQWTLKNFGDIYGLTLEGHDAGLQFQLGAFNSAVTSIGVVSSSLVFNTMAAYFFARLPFPGKRFLFAYVIGTFMLPADLTIVPLFIVCNYLGLTNTYWAMIVPFYTSPFIVFLVMQFMYGMPKELDEAALVDGANYWQILWQVVFPNMLPALTTAALIEFQFIWNNFYWPLVAVDDAKLQVIQVMIATQTTDRQTFWGRTFAGMVTAVLPVLILFLFCQRFYYRGVVLTGMKA